MHANKDKRSVLSFSLIDNAKDSLSHAVEHLINFGNAPEVRDYKIAICDLYHAIELLLKERLTKIHPAFIYEKIDQYGSSDARTVTALGALQRIRTLDKVKLLGQYKNIVKSCGKVRNKIEHFSFEVSSNQAKAIIGSMLSFIFWFARTQLNECIESEFKKDDRWKSLIDIHEFFEEHRKIIEEELQGKNIDVWPCPYCSGNAFVVDDGCCKLCEHREDVLECDICKNEYLESETEHIEGGGEECESYDYVICRDCLKAEKDDARGMDLMASLYSDK